ncbi:MAG: PIN domain-containing protein, partial [Clostridia bacterium]
MTKPKFLIIDANSIINRAFYGIRLLTAKDGTYTNAVYGFLNIFYKYKEEIKPDYIAAAFDLKAPTFRHKMFDGYKATRKPMPEELRPQIPLLKEVLAALSIPVLEMEGYEADDIIGTVAARCTESDIACMILTGD